MSEKDAKSPATMISGEAVSETPPQSTKTIDIVTGGLDQNLLRKAVEIDQAAAQRQKSWKEEKTLLHDLITATESHEVLIAFLPDVSTLIELQVESALIDAFQMPSSFWKSIAREASGFFGSRGIPAGEHEAAVSSMFYRFLIKQPVPQLKKLSKFKDSDPEYVWLKLGYFLSWTPQGKIRILCFDFPKDFQELVTKSVNDIILGPGTPAHLILNNILIEGTVSLFDKSVWLWRDVVRNYEKNRPSTGIEPPNPDYIILHEIARHIIHSSETLAVSEEILKSMAHCYKSILKATDQSSDIQAELHQQASLLKCVHFRSQAIEARLRNEINLAFNLVAQYDARSAVQISTNTADDSAAMKTISVLGLTFLPGTFISSLFSTTFFNFTPADDSSPQKWSMSNMFWIYFAVTVPITLLTLLCWVVWNQISLARAVEQTEAIKRNPTIYAKVPQSGLTMTV